MQHVLTTSIIVLFVSFSFSISALFGRLRKSKRVRRSSDPSDVINGFITLILMALGGFMIWYVSAPTQNLWTRIEIGICLAGCYLLAGIGFHAGYKRNPISQD